MCLTRVGCFLSGCCFGTAWDGPWAVTFPSGTPAGQFQAEVHAAGLHPAQLYESLGGLVVLVLLLAVGRRLSPWNGLQFFFVIVLYSVLRFMVEFARHFEPGDMFGPLTHNQVVCVMLLAVFGYLGVRAMRAIPQTAPA